ncbi:olfactory receptor 8S1-like [Rhineura floridana]|uniref:olfactory receptor 8S1-like n=1 Tax=Rhineura floridana TaxID=261503 RepID=UPI002AC87158|nr:olfactory receptor 8S1-like [Rhineura floridana]XP_061446299.1 olfactory receptor 8S1-like [Rhineura floridana]
MENQTVITEFILLGLSRDPHLQVIFFFLFLVIFLVTLLGNSAIMLVTRTVTSLQNPMFFFLSHLAFVDICYSSVTVPRMLENIIGKQKTISLEGCIAQIFFIFQVSCAEVFILAAMAYDRYAAICDPLHYTTIMKKEICRYLVSGAWAMGFLCSLVNALPLLNLHFCKNNIMDNYSCELPSVLALSCTQTLTNYIVLLITALVFGFSPFLLTLISYVHIISTILKIRSAEGRRKAFSTCSSHLIVVGLFYIAAFIRYVKPNSKSLIYLDKVVSIQYSIITPMLNPIIYSLKNKDIKNALAKKFGKFLK